MPTIEYPKGLNPNELRFHDGNRYWTITELAGELKRLRTLVDEPATREARWWATYNAAVTGLCMSDCKEAIMHDTAVRVANRAHGELKP